MEQLYNYGTGSITINANEITTETLTASNFTSYSSNLTFVNCDNITINNTMLINCDINTYSLSPAGLNCDIGTSTNKYSHIYCDNIDVSGSIIIDNLSLKTLKVSDQTDLSNTTIYDLSINGVIRSDFDFYGNSIYNISDVSAVMITGDNLDISGDISCNNINIFGYAKSNLNMNNNNINNVNIINASLGQILNVSSSFINSNTTLFNSLTGTNCYFTKICANMDLSNYNINKVNTIYSTNASFNKIICNIDLCNNNINGVNKLNSYDVSCVNLDVSFINASFHSGNILPLIDSCFNLGSYSYKWNKLYVNNLSTDIMPEFDNCFNFGSNSFKWNQIYTTTLYSTNINCSGDISPTINNLLQLGTSNFKWNVLYVNRIANDICTSSISPLIDSCYNLGSSNFKWDKIYANTIYSTNIISSLNVSGSVLPSIDSCFNLGSSNFKWDNLYVNSLYLSNDLSVNIIKVNYFDSSFDLSNNNITGVNQLNIIDLSISKLITNLNINNNDINNCTTLYSTNINGFKLLGNINCSGNTLSNVGTINTTNLSTTNLTSHINCGTYNLTNIGTIGGTNLNFSKSISSIDFSFNDITNLNYIGSSYIAGTVLQNLAGYQCMVIYNNSLTLKQKIIPENDICYNLGDADYRWLNFYTKSIICDDLSCNKSISSIDFSLNNITNLAEIQGTNLNFSKSISSIDFSLNNISNLTTIAGTNLNFSNSISSIDFSLNNITNLAEIQGTNLNFSKSISSIDFSLNNITNLTTIAGTNLNFSKSISNIDFSLNDITNLTTIQGTNLNFSNSISSIDFSLNNITNLNKLYCCDICANNIMPSIDNCYNLGSANLKFQNINCVNLNASYIYGQNVSGSLIPLYDSCFNLGSNDFKWNNIYTNSIILNDISTSTATITNLTYTSLIKSSVYMYPYNIYENAFTPWASVLSYPQANFYGGFENDINSINTGIYFNKTVNANYDTTYITNKFGSSRWMIGLDNPDYPAINTWSTLATNATNKYLYFRFCVDNVYGDCSVLFQTFCGDRNSAITAGICDADRNVIRYLQIARCTAGSNTTNINSCWYAPYGGETSTTPYMEWIQFYLSYNDVLTYRYEYDNHYFIRISTQTGYWHTNYELWISGWSLCENPHSVIISDCYDMCDPHTQCHNYGANRADAAAVSGMHYAYYPALTFPTVDNQAYQYKISCHSTTDMGTKDLFFGFVILKDYTQRPNPEIWFHINSTTVHKARLSSYCSGFYGKKLNGDNYYKKCVGCIIPNSVATTLVQSSGTTGINFITIYINNFDNAVFYFFGCFLELIN